MSTPAPWPPVTVLLVDDHALLRAGVHAEIARRRRGGRGGHRRRSNGGERRLTPEVVLLDVHMPDGGGLAVLHGVATQDPPVRFLALSVSDAAEDVIALIRAGARGYVTKAITGRTWWRQSAAWPTGTQCSPRLAGSCSTHLPTPSRARPARRDLPATTRPARTTSTASPRASAKCCASSPAATCTRE